MGELVLFDREVCGVWRLQVKMGAKVALKFFEVYKSWRSAAPGPPPRLRRSTPWDYRELYSGRCSGCKAAMLSSLLAVSLCIFVAFVQAGSDYHERLLLRPLPQNALLASFNFRSNESSSSFERQNFKFFPRSLGQILQHANTKELHLRFSLGRWDAESWGARPWDGAREGGTGVELWAWVDAESEAEYDGTLQKELDLANIIQCVCKMVDPH
jgi:hypothetical protein